MGLELEPNSEFMVSNVCARDWGYVSNCLTLNKSPTVNNPIWRQNGNIWRFLVFWRSLFLPEPQFPHL